MSITIAKFLDVASGTQAGQFTIGDREVVTSLDDLDPIYKRLIDEPVTAIVSVMGRTEVSEDDPEQGSRVTAQLDHIWTKYTGAEPPYGLRDPSMDERRVLFEMGVDSVATFGQP